MNGARKPASSVMLGLKLATGTILALLIGVAILFSTASNQLDPFFRMLAREKLKPAHSDLLAPGILRVFVCGSSSPLATRKRAKTCIGVFADGQMLLFDTGAGSWRNIANWDLPVSSLRHIFLTHFHSDHIADLDEANVQSWIFGRSVPLMVHGPTGVTQVVEGYNQALAPDLQYRNVYGTQAHFPKAAGKMLAAPFQTSPGKRTLIYRRGSLRVWAFPVDHRPVVPAVGYVVEYGDRKVVISGDTRKIPLMSEMARGADILFHEAGSARLSKIMEEAAREDGNRRMAFIMHKAGDYHTRAEDIASFATKGGPKRIIMYHLAPPPGSWPLRRIFLRGMPSTVSIAEDGEMFALKPGSTQIVERNLD